MRFFLFSVLLSSVCLSAVFCQDNSTTTTTASPTSTTTLKTTTLVDTTTTATTKNTTTTTTTPSTTTTTTPASTSTTTTVAPTPDAPVFDFRIPKNESVPACLRAKMSLKFAITYTKEVNGTKSNETVKVELKERAGYEGECQKSFETLTVDFKEGWSLEFNYTLNAYYELNSIHFKYVVDEETFPNVTASELGPKSVDLVNQSLFSANQGTSYKCYAETDVTLSDNVVLEITKYQAQPFLDPKNKDFDTATECSADTTGTSKLVPIIVGASLAALVIMVLVAYIIGRRKHRPGYQQV